MAVKIKRFRFVKFRFVIGFGFWIDDMDIVEHGYDGRTVTIILPFIVYQLRAIALYNEKEKNLQIMIRKRRKEKEKQNKK